MFPCCTKASVSSVSNALHCLHAVYMCIKQCAPFSTCLSTCFHTHHPVPALLRQVESAEHRVDPGQCETQTESAPHRDEKTEFHLRCWAAHSLFQDRLGGGRAWNNTLKCSIVICSPEQGCSRPNTLTLPLF